MASGGIYRLMGGCSARRDIHPVAYHRICSSQPRSRLEDIGRGWPWQGTFQRPSNSASLSPTSEGTWSQSTEVILSAEKQLVQLAGQRIGVGSFDSLDVFSPRDHWIPLICTGSSLYAFSSSLREPSLCRTKHAKNHESSSVCGRYRILRFWMLESRVQVNPAEP